MNRILTSHEATVALGEAIGRSAIPGLVISLVGDLGVGKTTLAKGIGAGLGVTSMIRSPTFILVEEHHSGRLPLLHADLYRLGDASELDVLGIDERPSDAVLVVEWASLFPEVLPADVLEVHLEDHNEGRCVHIRSTGPISAQVENSLV